MRSDLVVKPWEQKLRELDAMWYEAYIVCLVSHVMLVGPLFCSLTLPPSSDVQMECMGCRDKMKVALETFQVCTSLSPDIHWKHTCPVWCMKTV